MIKFFFGNRPFVLIFLPILILMFGLLNELAQHQVAEDFVYFGLWGNISGQNYWWYKAVSFLFVFINATLINNTFNRYDFMEKNNYLTSLLYVVIMSFFHSFYFTLTNNLDS